MGHCSSQIFERYNFICYCLDNFRSGDEHVCSFVNHDNKVCDGRTVHCTTCARAHNDADLWHNARGTNVAEENFSIGAQGGYTFLNTSATGIVQANHRTSCFECHVENFANLESMHFTQRATVDGKILCECKYFTSVDFSMPSHDTVSGDDVFVHVKVTATVFNESIDLLEGALIKQHIESFSSGHFPAIVLSINSCLTSTGFASSLSSAQVIETLFCG